MMVVVKNRKTFEVRQYNAASISYASGTYTIDLGGGTTVAFEKADYIIFLLD